MTTTAQLALKAFEDAWITVNYTGMTSANKTTHIQTYFGLKIAAAKEIEANRVESETAQTTANNKATSDLTSMLTQLGFAVDNSQADWNMLYNYPEVYGANWQAQSNYQKSISTGVDYFLNQVRNSIVFKPYEIGVSYKRATVDKPADTFVYEGVLYRVEQDNVSQADWIPSNLPALYTKIVPAGVIAAWVQPTGSQDAYAVGVKVTYGGFTWINTIPANVWQPGVAGWSKI